MKDTEPVDVPLTQSEGKPMVLNGEGEMPREVETAVDLTAAIADSTVSIVKLAENIVIQSTLTVARIVTLDLNGHVLAYENSQDRGSVFVVEGGGHLTIQDSNPDALHRFTPNSDGLWVLDEENGTETVSGGVITGGTGYRISLGNSSVHYDAYYGGAVYIANGQLTMTGGNMIGCSAKDGGGGVFQAE